MRILRTTSWLWIASAGLVAGEDMITFVRSDFVGNITNEPNAAVFIVDGYHNKTFAWKAINNTVVEGINICTVKADRECGTVAIGIPTPTPSSWTRLSTSAPATSASSTPVILGQTASALTPVLPNSAAYTSPPSPDDLGADASTPWQSSWNRRRALLARQDSDESGNNADESGDLESNEMLRLTVESTRTNGRVVISAKVLDQLMANYARVPMYIEALWANDRGKSYSRRFALVPVNEDTSSYADNYSLKNMSSIYPEFNPDTASLSASFDSTMPSPTSAVEDSAPITGEGSAPDGGLPTGAVVGIAIACGATLLGLATAVLWMLCNRHNSAMDAVALVNGSRNPEITTDKEAGEGVSTTPHSPYSDITPKSSNTAASKLHQYKHASRVDRYGESGSQFTGSSVFGGSFASGSPGAAAEKTPSLTRPVAEQDWPLPRTHAATNWSTSSGVTGPYAHLVEEGMTEEQILRLQEEERQIDAAIAEQAATRRR